MELKKVREVPQLASAARPQLFGLFLGGFANGVFGAADCVLHLARRLLGGSFSLRFRIASHLADSFLDGPFNPMSRSFNTVLVPLLARAEEPVVRRLCAGGNWIRTIGPASGKVVDAKFQRLDMNASAYSSTASPA
jgi:hypothetical protein